MLVVVVRGRGASSQRDAGRGATRTAAQPSTLLCKLELASACCLHTRYNRTGEYDILPSFCVAIDKVK